ncbi:unnamed protein product [Spirodela intermedia]|uniref:Uncharacterized protein n=1 Tax=Spirodela intermedia TaxID=51605 RepID=A0ABN7E9U3_SPIIN|nr:unnamed protein product [Spirodela intermedia]
MGHRVVSGGCHRRSGKIVTLQLSDSCHPTKRSWMEVGRGASSSGPRSKRSSSSHLVRSQEVLPTRLRARLAGGSPPFCNILVLFLFLHLSQK